MHQLSALQSDWSLDIFSPSIGFNWIDHQLSSSSQGIMGEYWFWSHKQCSHVSTVHLEWMGPYQARSTQTRTQLATDSSCQPKSQCILMTGFLVDILSGGGGKQTAMIYPRLANILFEHRSVWLNSGDSHKKNSRRWRGKMDPREPNLPPWTTIIDYKLYSSNGSGSSSLSSILENQRREQKMILSLNLLSLNSPVDNNIMFKKNPCTPKDTEPKSKNEKKFDTFSTGTIRKKFKAIFFSSMLKTWIWIHETEKKVR